MRALIVVDIQNDFIPGGAMAVAEGDQIVPVVNRLQQCFDLIVATQDWHPAAHGSFAANHDEGNVGEVIDLDGLQQILWPEHCIQNTSGAAFVTGLDQSRWSEVFKKGTDPSIERGVTDVYVVGLATDYCVKFTALDACRLGFNTLVIEDACRGVNVIAGDVDRAIEDMRRAGVTVVTSAAVLQGSKIAQPV